MRRSVTVKKTESKVLWALKRIFFGVAAGLILFALFIILLDFIFPYSERKVTLNTETGMTSAGRVSDFRAMTELIEKKVPFIYDYEELYKISFEDVKNYYSKLVENAESDYEYYCLVQGFINNIPSGHMTMGYPSEALIPAMYQYTAANYAGFGEACGYWENVLHNECRKYYDEDYSLHAFYYLNGEYVESEYTNSVNNISYGGARLLSVDGVSADEFVKLCPLSAKLNYDFQQDKPFRETIIFNSFDGVECTVEYETESGEIVSERAYYCASAAVDHIEYFRRLDKPSPNAEEIPDTADIPNIYTAEDVERNVLYIKFNDFILGATEASRFIRGNALPDNIIIDLRDNGGGYKANCDNLIAALSTRDIEFNGRIYCTYKIIDDFTAVRSPQLPFESRFKKLYAKTEENLIHGESGRKYNIYVLVSPHTLSAADRFTAIVKESGLGTVVGAFNTGGEAFGSPDIAVLEKSGLYFYYTDYKYVDSDGRDNSVYGTAPDVYVTLDDDFLKNRDEAIFQGESYGTYEKRLEWDSVLSETLEMINEAN